MRKSLLIITIILYTITARGQVTGGGDQQQTSKTAKVASTTNKWSSGNFGLSAPIGKFGKNDITADFDEAAGAKIGIFVDWSGGRYFTDGTPMKYGLMQKFAFVVNFADWDTWIPGSSGDFTPFMLVEYKLGGLATYEVSSVLELDGFLLFGVDVGLGASGYWSSSSIDFSPESVGVGFGWTLGVAARFSGLRVSMSIDPTKLGMNYLLSSPAGSQTTEYKVPMSTFRLGIGFSR